ncbi:hypothetical protein EYR40_008479 [Pleurotus pulmonarius]|nr:hypothetical protein EYR36_009297 [Pleurotus pulmonarius]KAF4593689.1 hypothetical protein EYR40_008479 [Pleurotus pulmonarius]
MKFSFAVVASLFIAAQAVALPAEVKEVEAADAAPRCPNSRNATPLYRAFNPSVTDHFYTTNAVEIRRGLESQVVVR